MAFDVSLLAVPGPVAAGATLVAIVILLVRYVLEPVLVAWQRRALLALALPFLAILVLYISVGLLQALL